jgi:hypothetical protein
MELQIEFTGDVVDRQELLNGTQSVDIEAADASGEWSLSGSFSWNRGLIDFAGEGDLTLTRHDGAEIFGTLTRALLTDAAEGDVDAQSAFTIDYEIDGGTGAFAGAAGSAHAQGVLGDTSFRGAWTMDLRVPEGSA